MTITTRKLGSGLTVAIEPMPALASASFALLIPRGSAWDPEGKCGLTAVLEEMLIRGAGDRNAREMTEAMDAIGMERSVDSSSEVIFISGSLLGRDLAKGLEFLRDIVTVPQLDESELRPSIDLCIQAIMAIEDSPSEKLFVELGKRYLPWPHGRPSKGVLGEIETVTTNDLRAAVGTFGPRGAVLALAGAVDESAAEIFESFNGRSEPAPLELRLPPPAPSHVENEGKAQVQVGMAMPSIPMSHPDYPKAQLLSAVLSGGMSGRLFVEVREKRGLVYAVRAFSSVMKDRGDLFVYAGTTPERARETISVIAGEFERLHQGIAQEELDRARTQLKSSVVMSQESSRSRAKTMATDFHRLGRIREPREIIDSINGVTLDEMNAFLAASTFEPMTVTLGPSWE